jgi:sec-independent protein translocase protein TatC
MAATERDQDYSYLDEEEEGGPRKTFLEHLEDLRWTLMKCAAVVGVGFLLCLFAAPYLVKFLLWPLENAGLSLAGDSQRVTMLVGTNRLGTFYLSTNQPNFFGTNAHTILELVPVQSGTNMVLGLQPSTNEVTSVIAGRRVGLINLGPASAFFTAIKMAIYGGIALAIPFLLYFIGQFVFPALKVTEKRYTYWALGFGSGLFALGLAFCYFVMMPLALKASVQYSEWLGFQVTDWKAEEYISFVSLCMLALGLAFELPVVILMLVKIGLLNYQKLSNFRVYMVVVNLVVAAILTPPDVVTQVLMAIPMQILYEISVWIAWYWDRAERKKEAREI